MRKPRPDSTIHNLPEELRQAVDDALAANATLKDVQAILAEGGVRLSLQSISEYYKLHLLPRIWAAEDHNAAQLAKIKRGNVTKATHAAVLQTCYEVITRPGKKSAADLQRLYGMVLAGQKAQMEAQRLKLASELGRGQSDSVFVFDEPTIGLHPLDVRTLLGVFQRLIDSGATVVVIEHDLDVIRNADYLVDLGPGGGESGGRIVACGTPEQVAADPASITGKYLHL